MNPPITKDGEYTTRSGAHVRIYATDGGGEYPVHGSFLVKDEWITRTWTADGLCNRLMKCHPDDLIPKPKVRKLDVWLNVYEREDGSLFTSSGFGSRVDATKNANRVPWYIGCIGVQREFVEGEGLGDA